MKQAMKIKIVVFCIVVILLVVCYLILEKPFSVQQPGVVDKVQLFSDSSGVTESAVLDSSGKQDQDPGQRLAVSEQQSFTSKPELFPVHIMGEVVCPGVFYVDQGTIVNDLVTLAGGLTATADLYYVNLAAPVISGQKVYIPSMSERDLIEKNPEIYENVQIDGLSIGSLESGHQEKPEKININKAQKEDLLQLTGIGPAKAEAIIAYREEFGEFKKVEDIMLVSGIKESSFEKIKEMISVD